MEFVQSIGAGTIVTVVIMVAGALAGYTRLQSLVSSLVDALQKLEKRIERDQADHRSSVDRATAECRAGIEALRKEVEVEFATLGGRVELGRAQFHELEVKIATDYVSREMMAGLEERFEKAIERLGDRFDKAVERMMRSDRERPPN